MEKAAGLDDESSQISKERLRLWLRLLSLTRAVEGLLRVKLRNEFGSTLPRFDVMAALDRTPEGVTMTKLSSMLRVSNGNITGLIDRLVDDNFAERKPVPGDRRANLVSLTSTGRDEFARMSLAHEVWISQVLEEFEFREATQLSERLRHVVRNIHTKQDAD